MESFAVLLIQAREGRRTKNTSENSDNNNCSKTEVNERGRWTKQMFGSKEPDEFFLCRSPVRRGTYFRFKLQKKAISPVDAVQTLKSPAKLMSGLRARFGAQIIIYVSPLCVMVGSLIEADPRCSAESASIYYAIQFGIECMATGWTNRFVSHQRFGNNTHSPTHAIF